MTKAATARRPKPESVAAVRKAQASAGFASAHHGASVYARDMAAWQTGRGSADSDLLPDLDMLVARSRDIARNNGVAKGGIQTIVDNVVGTGLRLSARPDYLALGKSKEWAADWAKSVESWWKQYWWTTACHAGDTLTGDQITSQQFRALLGDGDAITLPLWINRNDGFKTKLQTVESDRLSNPNLHIESNSLKSGIEFDQYGAPIAYHFRNSHPGDFLYTRNTFVGNPNEWTRVPRKTPFGRLRVLHMFDSERSGQSRGKPILSSVLGQFKNLDRYAGAELQAAVLNAMIAGIITTPLDQDGILELFKNDANAYMQARADRAVKLEAGTMLPLFPGDEIKPFLPQRPAAAFGQFVENVFRMIAVACDMPYELLLKDFSKTTYSSARAAMLEAWRSFLRRRDSLGTQWGDPIYWLFLEELVNDGRVEAPGFYENRAAYQTCKWIGPGRGWVDPIKEAQAAVIRLDNNLSTLEEECAQQGLDWREVLEQRAVERDEMKRLGLPDHTEIRAANPPQGGVDNGQPATGIQTGNA